MEPTQQSTLSFEESIKQVMQTLPPPIRQYLAQGKYSVVAGNLMTKYGLHVDQGGILEREIMLLLMGIDSPDEFTESLVEEAKISQDTVRNIVQDVNAQIFVPLREEMRRGAQQVPQAQVSKPPVSMPARPQQSQQQPQRHFQLQNKIPPPAEVKPPQPTTQRPDLRNVLNAITAKPKLLEDHEEPHFEFHKTTPPPANLPGIIQSPKITEVRPSPIIPPPSLKATEDTARSVPQAPPKPIIKEYSTDPYREPIE